ncbi:MAG: hypothetical protein CMH59_15930, partial [Myxococcales bacterium]|nr:hypothetical protein [Myxococcales bacterium]
MAYRGAPENGIADRSIEALVSRVHLPERRERVTKRETEMRDTVAATMGGATHTERFAVGTRIGGREVIGFLGEGGSSELWVVALRGPRGETQALQAVKRARPGAPTAARIREMLVREGQLARRVRHPNVVRVEGVLLHDGEPLVLMELVRGVSLARISALLRTRGVRLPIGWVATLGAALARGLHAAHICRDSAGRPLGLVHRDVSPSNAVLGFDGVPRLLDFGVAKPTAHQPESVAFRGTLSYAAPEQLRGETVGPPADVHGLGAVLVELVTGARPFGRAKFLELCERRGTIRPLRPSHPELPPVLDTLLTACLERDPQRRPASASGVATLLERIAEQAGAPTEAQLGRLAEAVREEAPRSRLLKLGLLPRVEQTEVPARSGVRAVSAPVELDDEDTQHDDGLFARREGPRPDPTNGFSEQPTRVAEREELRRALAALEEGRAERGNPEAPAPAAPEGAPLDGAPTRVGRPPAFPPAESDAPTARDASSELRARATVASDTLADASRAESAGEEAPAADADAGSATPRGGA